MADETEMVKKATETEAEAPKQQEEPKAETVEEKPVDVKAMQEALKKANHEAAATRKKLQAFEEAERKRKEAEMSELEKAQAKIDELQKQTLEAVESARMRAIQAEVIGLSATLEYADPKDALAMIDMSKVEMTEGVITGVKEQLEALAKSKPYLLKSTKTNVSIRSTNAANVTGKTESDEERRRRLF